MAGRSRRVDLAQHGRRRPFSWWKAPPVFLGHVDDAAARHKQTYGAVLAANGFVTVTPS
jgi:hypothetical protein